MQKLREARALINASGRDIRLQVDGGVTAANIKEIAEVFIVPYVRAVMTIIERNFH